MSYSYFTLDSPVGVQSVRPQLGQHSSSCNGWPTVDVISDSSGSASDAFECPICPPFGFPVLRREFGITLFLFIGVCEVGVPVHRSHDTFPKALDMDSKAFSYDLTVAFKDFTSFCRERISASFSEIAF